ncbi:MAG: restriction endonuclease, partial [Candidatus Methanofastidiosia archaeon]
KRGRLFDMGDIRHEIDVYAESPEGQKILIECKQTKDEKSIGIHKATVDIIITKNAELEADRGIIVTTGSVSQKIRDYANRNDIIIWDGSDLRTHYKNILKTKSKRKYLYEELSLGMATMTRFASVTRFELCYPVNVLYEEAIKLHLINSNEICKTRATLYFMPYFVIDYILKGMTTDPTGKLHKFEDDDSVIIDWSSEIVPNTDKKLINQLKMTPIENYEFRGRGDFKIQKQRVEISEDFASQSATIHIIDRNTEDKYYYVRKRGGEKEKRKITYIPKKKEIMIKSMKLVYVPFWVINFICLDQDYERYIFASSKKIDKDTIQNCPNHRNGKITYAVCEKCGLALCNDCIHKCVDCGKYLCDEHFYSCPSCRYDFCEKHLTERCNICNKYICNDCLRICPICRNIFCKKHKVNCKKCGESVCKNCAESKGFPFFRKWICYNCKYNLL